MSSSRSRTKARRPRVKLEPEFDFLLLPYSVVIDTREQHPFAFQNHNSDAKDGRRPLIVPTVRACLQSGDYSIQGFEQRVAVERKSLVDLFGSLGSGRERFEREIQRLSVFDFAAVVVEGDWGAVLSSPPPQSELRPKTVFRTVVDWQQDYPRVHWWFCSTRGFAELVTLRVLNRFWERDQRVKAEAKGTMQ